MPSRPVSKRDLRPAALCALLALALALPAFGQSQTRPPRDQGGQEGVDAGAVVGTVLDVARRAEEARRKREAERREARERERERERELEREAAERQREDQAAEDRAEAEAQARAREADRADADRAEAARASAERAREQRVAADRAAERERAARVERESRRRAAEPEAAVPTPSPIPEPAPAAAPPASPPTTSALLPPAPPPQPVTPANDSSPLRLPFILLGIAVALLVAGVAVSRVVIAVFGPKPRAVARIDTGKVSAPDFGGKDAELPAPTARAVPGDFTSDIDYPAPAAEAS